MEKHKPSLLLKISTVLASSVFAAASAFTPKISNAADVPAAGGTAGAYTVTNDVTITGGTVTNSTGNTNNTVIMGTAGKTLTVGDGIGGAGTAIVTSTNSKYAITTGAGTDASSNITVASDGKITNINAITAIYLQNTFGTITVNSGGSIAALTTGVGIDVHGITMAGISNSGTISTASGSAIFISSASTITGGISNLGTVQSTAGKAINIGAALTGAITNGSGVNSTATIKDTTTGTGLYLGADVSGGVSNYGNISATTTGVGVSVAAAQTSAAFTNQSTGVISSANTTTTSASFLIGADISNSLLNYGTISNTTLGNAIYVSAAMTSGGIVNKSGGVISNTTGGGLKIAANIGGGVSNSGSITVTSGNGIYVSAISTITGGISNLGTISSIAGTGINIGAALTGAIVNGSGVNSTATITDTSSGTGILLAANITGGVQNYGTISSSTGKAVSITAAQTGTTFYNQSTGTITTAGTNGAIVVNNVKLTNGITNDGTISSTNGTPIAIDASAQTTAGNAFTITNNGTITGEVKLGKNDTFTQTGGSTDGGATGIAILGAGGSEIVNLNGGTITGDIGSSGSNISQVNIGGATTTDNIYATALNFGGDYALSINSAKSITSSNTSTAAITTTTNNTGTLTFAGSATIGNIIGSVGKVLKTINFNGGTATISKAIYATNITVASGANANFTATTSNLGSITNSGTVSINAGVQTILGGAYTSTGTTTFGINNLTSGLLTPTFGNNITLGGSTINIDTTGITSLMADGKTFTLINASANSGVITQTGTGSTFAANNLVTDNSSHYNFYSRIINNQYQVQSVYVAGADVPATGGTAGWYGLSQDVTVTSGTVTNSADGTGATVVLSSLSNGRTLTINSGATITSTASNSITLAGNTTANLTVAGTLTAATATSAFDNNGQSFGTITVNSGGAITMATTGNAITLSGGTVAGILNSGTIYSGSYSAIRISGATTITNGITNLGTIYSSTGGASHAAIRVNTLLTGAIVNGSSSNSTATISNTYGVGGYGLYLDADVTGGVDNYGTISSAAKDAVTVNSALSSAFTNRATGVITSGNATTTSGTFVINNSIGGNLLNYGTINNTADGNAISVSSAMNNGSIINQVGGVISNSSTGRAMYITADVRSGVHNYGTISTAGDKMAVYVGGSGMTSSFINEATGLITTSATVNGSFQANSQVAGGVLNYGTITNTSTGSAVALVTQGTWTTGFLTNKAGGVIQNTSSGIGLRVMTNGAANTSIGGGLNNYGIISSSTGNAVRIDASQTTSPAFNNYSGGLITTGGAGGAFLLNSDIILTNGLSNAGTISSTNGTPIAIDASAQVTSGNKFTITNSGTITGQVKLGRDDTFTQTGGSTNGGATGIAILGTGNSEIVNLNGGTITGDIGTSTNYIGTLNLGTSASLSNIYATALNFSGDYALTIGSGNSTTSAITTTTTNTGTLTFAGSTNITSAIGTSSALLKAINFNGGTSILGIGSVLKATNINVASGANANFTATTSNLGSITNSGTVTINASYTITLAGAYLSTGTTTFGITGASQGKLTITGAGNNVTLGGSTITINPSGFMTSGTVLTLIDATANSGTITQNGVGSSFSANSLVTSTSSNYTFYSQITGNQYNVQAFYTPGATTDVPATGGTAGSYSLNSNATVASGTVTNSSNSSMPTVILSHLSNGNTLTVNAGATITSVANNTIVLADSTTANITVAGGTISAARGYDVIATYGQDLGTIAVNSGTISATGGGNAIRPSAGTITGITNSGLISSETGYGLWIGGITVTNGITNLGTITSVGGNGIRISSLNYTGTITNGSAINSTATISDSAAGTALYLGGWTSGTISNYGIISGNTGSALTVAAAQTSSIINQSTGVITSAQTAVTNGSILISADIAGSLLNYGTITNASTGNAIYVSGAMTTGGIINQAGGVISNSSTGVGLKLAANVGGGVQNDGSISSVTGQAVYISSAQTSSFVNQSTGVISSAYFASSSGSFLIGADISNSLLNYGTISNASAGNAIFVSAAMTSGGIVNKSGGLISNTSGGALKIAVNIGGGVTNSGSITVTTGSGIYVSAISTITGGITNLGTVSSVAGTGINIGFALTGGIVNGSGTNSTATINDTSSGRGVLLAANVSGGVQNYGIISSSTGNAVSVTAAQTGSTFYNQSTGVITTAGAGGAFLVGNFALTNGITNAGTISSTNGTPIAIDASAQTTAGNAFTITNSGTITGQVKLGKNDIFTQTSGSTNGGATGIAILGAGGSEIVNLNGGTITGDIGSSGSNISQVNIGGATTTDNIYATALNFGGDYALSINSAKSISSSNTSTAAITTTTNNTGTLNFAGNTTIANIIGTSGNMLKAININGGTATISKSINATTTTVASGATANFTTTSSNSGSITNSGTVSINPGATVTLAGSYTSTGATNYTITGLSAGKLVITGAGNNATLGGSAINITVNGVVNINSIITLIDATTDGGTITQNGTGGAFATNALLTSSSPNYVFSSKIVGNQYLIQAAFTPTSNVPATGGTAGGYGLGASVTVTSGTVTNSSNTSTPTVILTSASNGNTLTVNTGATITSSAYSAITLAEATTANITVAGGTVSAASGYNAIDNNGLDLGTITISSGTISATGAGNAINLSGGTVASISNSGSISSATGAGINISAATILTSGITNLGTISSTGGTGVSIGAILTGAITNGSVANHTATITSAETSTTSGAVVIGADVTGNLINHGIIRNTAAGNAVYVSSAMTTGAIVNQASSSITNTSTGVGLNIAANIAGGVQNYGSISSTGNVAAVKISAAQTGSTFFNQVGGLITTAGTVAAVVVGDVGLTNGITNAGTISSTNGTKIAIDASAQTTAGNAFTITNSGTITGQVSLGKNDTYTQSAGVLTGVIQGIAAGGSEIVNLNGGTVSGNISNVGTLNIGSTITLNALVSVTATNFSGDYTLTMNSTKSITSSNTTTAAVTTTTNNTGTLTFAGTSTIANIIGTSDNMLNTINFNGVDTISKSVNATNINVGAAAGNATFTANTSNIGTLTNSGIVTVNAGINTTLAGSYTSTGTTTFGITGLSAGKLTVTGGGNNINLGGSVINISISGLIANGTIFTLFDATANGGTITQNGVGSSFSANNLITSGSLSYVFDAQIVGNQYLIKAIYTPNASGDVPGTGGGTLGGYGLTASVEVTSGTVTNSSNTSGLSTVVLDGLANGNTLTIGNGSIITSTANATIKQTDHTTANIVVGSGGTISAASGTNAIDNNGLNLGTITVANSGTISTTGAGNAIQLSGGIVTGISNSGSITAATGAGIAITGATTITNNIVNLGTVQSTAGKAININAALTGSIINGSSTNSYATISDTTSGYGIYLNGDVSGGVGNYGTISAATGYGILVNSAITSGITNYSTGTITSAQTVNTNGTIKILANMDGALTNNGTISVTSTGTAINIGANVGGGVVNSGSIIASSGRGIYVTAASTITGGITNLGTIQTTNGRGIFVNAVLTGAIVNGSSTNSTATIADTTTGIGLYLNADITGGVSNYGIISATGTANSTNSAIQVLSALSSSIVNQSTGLMIAAESNNTTSATVKISADIAGGLLNYGTIQNTSVTAGNVIYVTAAMTTGGINNAAGGLIKHDGTGRGLNIAADIGGGVVNSGSIIVNGGSGILISSASTITGGITNLGTVQSTAGNAFSVGAVLTGAIINGSATNHTASIIDTSTGYGLNLSADVTGGVQNYGIISNTTGGGTGRGVYVGAAQSSSFINQVGGYISGAAVNGGYGAFDIVADIAGGLTNLGTITASAGSGLVVDATMTGGITNGSLTNSTATISNSSGVGNSAGLRFNSGGVAGGVTNYGVITNTSGNGGIGLFVWGASTANINNFGTISATAGKGLSVNAALTGTITNGSATNHTATITDYSTGTGLLLIGDVTGGIQNYGIISSGTGNAVNITAAQSGPVFNNYSGGVITTGGTGGAFIVSDVLTSGINNAGTISSTNSAAIAIDASSQTTAGNAFTITNSGTITGQVKLGASDIFTQTGGTTNNGTGIAILGAGGAETINLNGGSIVGDIGTSSSNFNAVNIGGASTIGNVYATDLNFTGDHTLTVASGNSLNSNNINTAVDNNGTINYSGDTAVVKKLGGSTRRFKAINFGGGSALVSSDMHATNVTVAFGAITEFTASTSNTVSNFTSSGTTIVDAGKTVSGLGDVTIASGGVLKIGVASPTSYGKLVTTSLTNNGSIAVSAPNNLPNNTTLPSVFSVTTTPVVSENLQISDSTNIYKVIEKVNGNNIDLLIKLKNEELLSNATGKALDVMRVNGTGSSSVQAALTSVFAANTLQQASSSLATLNPNTSGQVNNAVIALQGAAVSRIQGRMDLLQSSMGGGRSGISSGDRSGISTGDEMEYEVLPDKVTINYKSMWLDVFGSQISQGVREGIAAYKATASGVIAGGDTYLNNKEDAKIGVAFAYGSTSSSGTSSKSAVSNYQGSLYGTYTPDEGPLHYDVVASVAYNKYESNRTLFDGTVANSKFGGSQYSMEGGVGYDIYLPNDVKLTPTASLQYSLLTQDKYTETGSSANLKVATNNLSSVKSGLGGKISKIFSVDGIKYTPSLTLEWDHDFLGQITQSNATFDGTSTSFIIRGGSAIRDSMKVGTGLNLLVKDQFNLSLDYTLEKMPSFTSNSLSLKAKFEF